MTTPTTPKKCNAPGGVCNRACRGSSMLGSPEWDECPYPEQPKQEPKRDPMPLGLLIALIVVAIVVGAWSIYKTFSGA